MDQLGRNETARFQTESLEKLTILRPNARLQGRVEGVVQNSVEQAGYKRIS